MSLLLGVGLALALAVALLLAVIRIVRLRRPVLVLPARIVETTAHHDTALDLTIRAAAAMPTMLADVTLAAGSRRHHEQTPLRWRNGAVTIPLRGVLRGLYRISTVRVRMQDPLDLVRVVWRTGPSVEATGPPVLRAAPTGPAGAPATPPRGIGVGDRDLRLSTERNDDLLDSRPYHPGDDTRRINWKTYAHGGELFVRIGEEVPPPAHLATVEIDARDAATPEQIDGLLAVAIEQAGRLTADGVDIAVLLTTGGGMRRAIGAPDRAWRVCAALDPDHGLLPGYEIGLAPVSVAPAGAGALVVGWSRAGDEDGGTARVWYRDAAGEVVRGEG